MWRRAISSIHLAYGLVAGTSANTPVAAGGLYPEPSRMSSRNTAVWARVTSASGQYDGLPFGGAGAQPPVTPRATSSSIQTARGSVTGTSANTPLAGRGAYARDSLALTS